MWHLTKRVLEFEAGMEMSSKIRVRALEKGSGVKVPPQVCNFSVSAVWFCHGV